MTTDSKTQTTRFRKPLRGALLAGALFLAACGSDGTEIASDPAEPATTTEAPSTTTEAAMDDAMEDAMLGAFGPACDAVPADGEGSFAGMADDTAATAASNNPLLSTLVTAVVEADLVDTLNSDGPFTIFAPTNDAFAAIPEDILGAVLADQDLLTAVLTYHVVGGDSLNAEALGSTGAAASVEVVQAELVDTLNSDGPFTIFAPVNDAFAALPADQLEAVLADQDLLTSILTYHVVAGASLSTDDLIEAGTIETVNGGELTIAAAGDVIEVNGVAATLCQNVPTANATVHIIDNVLLPTS